METCQIEIQVEDNQATVQWEISHSQELIREKHLKNQIYYNHMTLVRFLKEETLIKKIKLRQDR